MKIHALIAAAYAIQCILDQDCRSSHIFDINSLYCVNNTCTRLKREGMNCTMPEECASFPYFGPLACSATCKVNNECFTVASESTRYCCRAIPKKGRCLPGRPGILSGCAAGQACELHGGKATCQEKDKSSWLVGSVCSIMGNILINIGINLQKKSYVQNKLEILRYRISMLAVGGTVYALGKCTSYAAYLFGSQSMIAGLSATGLISNSIFAPLINDEIFTWKDAAAIFLVLLGSWTIISNSGSSHIVYSICELKKMYKGTGVLIWFAFIIFAITALFFVVKFVEVNGDWEAHDERFIFLRCSRYFEEDGFVCTYLMVFVYVLLSSFIASFTTLSVKSLAEMIERIHVGENPLFSWLFLFFLVTLLLCTFFQIYWLNRALKHFDALLVIPIFHISWTLLSIFTAWIYFQDFDHYTYRQVRNFIIGICVIFTGSLFLAGRITNRSAVATRLIDVPEEARKKDE